jgi:hypothetical protein
MAAPEFVPVPATARSRGYESPDHVPEGWTPDRPADLDGRQPQGDRLGYQGPDQGFALRLANLFRSRLQLRPGEHGEDVVEGCLGIALRRASLYGRAPVVHDLDIAFTVWGYLDPSPPDDLVAVRKRLFEGVHLSHHYAEARDLADRVPEATLRLTPPQVSEAYGRGGWRELLGG